MAETLDLAQMPVRRWRLFHGDHCLGVFEGCDHFEAGCAWWVASGLTCEAAEARGLPQTAAEIRFEEVLAPTPAPALDGLPLFARRAT
jgi:hypothetical protein